MIGIDEKGGNVGGIPVLRKNRGKNMNETKRQYEYLEVARKKVEKLSREAGRKLTFCVNTFGCQMNARDSEKLVVF